MKLRVENLAKIQHAEINVKNLTLFVGQNSTNKSYMAHIIYELYKEIHNINFNWNKRNRIIASISKNLFLNYENEISDISILEKEITENIERYQIAEDDWEEEIYTIVKIKVSDNTTFSLLQEKTIKLFLKEISKLINSSFNSTSTILEKLFIQDIDFTTPKKEDLILHFNIPLEYFEEENEDIRSKIVNSLVSSIVNKFENVLKNHDTAYYFPASRTGFVLTLDEIYAGIFRDKFRGQVSATRLGEPTIDFIQTFADFKTGNIKSNLFKFNINDNSLDSSNKLIKFLEENIIKGKIKEKRNEQDYTSYFLRIEDKELDLHLASSATLETLPFIVFLKNTDNIPHTLFVIEEPEAHLHPKAQIQMAKFIVLLANTGAKVLVTTHSDYILNEINNCIKLSSIEKNDEFAISKDDVSSYLFKNEEYETSVTELDIDKYGISNDIFDEVLDELLDRSENLTEKISKNV